MELAMFLDLLNPVASISHHSHLVFFLALPLIHACAIKVTLSDYSFTMLCVCWQCQSCLYQQNDFVRFCQAPGYVHWM